MTQTIAIPVKIYMDARYYASMPQSIFDALNAAFLNNQPNAIVDKSQFDAMMHDFNNRGSFIRQN